MIITKVGLPKPQFDQLKQLSEEMDLPLTELVRIAIREWLAGNVKQSPIVKKQEKIIEEQTKQKNYLEEIIEDRKQSWTTVVPATGSDGAVGLLCMKGGSKVFEPATSKKLIDAIKLYLQEQSQQT